MEATRLAFAGALLVLIARAALGQQPAVVQLPTYSYFAVGTTVSVPDRGAVSLGGIDRARSDAQSFASPLSPRGNSALGAERGAAGAGLSAIVHDFASAAGVPSAHERAECADGDRGARFGAAWEGLLVGDCPGFRGRVIGGYPVNLDGEAGVVQCLHGVRDAVAADVGDLNFTGGASGGQRHE